MMLALKSTTRVCPRCSAPNPKRLDFCYACSADLSEPSLNLPKRGELTFTCLECKGKVPFRALTCPHCRKAVARVERLWEQTIHEDPLPKGWHAQPLTNGTVLLRRAGWNIWRVPNIQFLLVPGGFAIALGIALIMLHTAIEKAGAASFLYAMFGIGALLGGAGIVLPIVLGEEICVGQDFLEVRRKFGWYRFRRRIEGGYLQVKTEVRAEGSGRNETQWKVRTLQADDYGKPLVLQEVYEGGFWSDEAEARHNVGNSVSMLALYLAEITRWRLRDETAGRYGE